MAQIKFTVGGIQYCVNSDNEDEAYIKGIASELEQQMDSIARKSPFLSTTMVAVLAALDAYDHAKKANNEIEHLRLEVKSALEQAAIAKLEADRLQRELDKYAGEGYDQY